MNRDHALSICSGVIFVLAVLALHAANTVAGDDAKIGKVDAATTLIGTWKLEKSKTPGSPSGIGARLKMFTGTHWCVVQPDPESGVIVFQHGGTYEFDGSEFKATVDFAGEQTSGLIGNTATVKLEITGDILKQTDPNGVFNETWRRVKRSNDK